MIGLPLFLRLSQKILEKKQVATRVSFTFF